MNCFNSLTHREMDCVATINSIDDEIKFLKSKITKLKDQRKKLVSELDMARLDMKIYLEQELGVTTQD